MTDATAKKVSLAKSGAAGSGAKRPSGPPPKTVLGAVLALGLSGLGAIIAAIDLYTLDHWLTGEFRKSDIKADKKHKAPTAQHLADQVSQAQRGALIGSLIVVVAVVVLGWAVYKGRYWSRWGVLIFWLLGSFSGTLIGISSLLSVGASIPMAYKAPSFVAGLGFVVAVVLVNLTASTAYFAQNRPVRPEGAPARRGLFGPRPSMQPRGAAARGAANRTRTTKVVDSAAVESAAERSRSKKRATVSNAESVAKGAELARSRAKASKSRRTDN